MGFFDVEPSRLDVAKAMLVEFVQNASENVRFSVVAFDAEIKSSLPLTEDKQTVTDALNGLTPSEGLPCLEEITDIGYGLQTSVDLLAPYASSDRSYAIVLVSDGFANFGFPDPIASVNSAIDSAVDRAVPVYSLHIALMSRDSNPDLLEYISNSTGGKFMDASNADELGSALDVLGKYHTPTNAWTTQVEVKTSIPQSVDLGFAFMLGSAAVIVVLWVGNYRHYKTWF
jgi:Mg-chelatase subunit ChlD